MKTQKLLVLGALCLFGLSANAADLIERKKPTLDVVQETPVAFEAGQKYILYNKGAEMYFTQGSTWSTRGCVVPNKESAVIVRPAKYTIEDVWDGKTYEIENYITPRTGNYSWYKMCMNGAGDLYLDQTTWSRFVEIKDQGSNVYRIMPNEVNNTVEGDNGGVVSDGTQFIGYAGLAWDNGGSQYDFGMGDNEDRVPLSALTTENVDWVFYSTAPYDAAMDVYEKAQQLKNLIEKAEEAGVDVSAAVAVYNNEASTIEQIEAAMKALNEALSAGITGSADAPGDATALLNNPDFDDASSEGWSGTAPNMVGSGSHGPANVAEVYNNTFDTYQDVMGMPAGVYGLSAFTTFRGSWDDYQSGLEAAAKLYATADDTTTEHAFDNMWSALNTESMGGPTEFGTNAAENSQKDGDITYFTPNDPSAARLYFEKGFYYNTLVFDVASGSARVGVKNPQKNGTGDNWSIFDTFRLTYYGNEGAASYNSWLKDNLQKLYSPEALSTLSVMARFESFINGLTASDAVSALSAFDTAKKSDELAALKKNIALWGMWKNKVAEATDFMSDEKYEDDDFPDDFETYINLDVQEIEEARALTNEEILAEIAKIDAWMEETKENAANALQPGDDLTHFLTNPAFDTNDWTGWTHNAASGGNVRVAEHCCEAWNNSNFDIYQEVKNAPIGVYAISVQGFYRYLREQNAWNAWNAQDNQYVKESPCKVYLNDIQTSFMNVFAEAITDNSIFGSHTDFNTFDGYYAPNDMATAADCFAADSEVNPGEKMFTQEAFGLISNVGDPLRIGVKGSSNQGGDSWVIFDNFKLTYMGNDLPTIKAVLEPKIAEAKALDGWMGKSVYAALQQAIADAENPANGDAAFAALKSIVAAVENAKASMAKFDELRTALENLNDIMNSGNINDNAKPEAQAFIANTYDDADDHLIEDIDIPGLMNKIKELTTKLLKPKEGSDASPANWTAVIINPDYVNNATTGWTSDRNPGYSSTDGYYCAEIYGGDSGDGVAFDYYQDIFGLDEGTYEVKVKGFYRFGYRENDYENLYDSSKSYACLYADGGAGISSKALVRLSAEAYGDNTTGNLSDITIDNSIVGYVPNSMSSAGELMYNYNNYQNSIIVKVNADGNLRIGIKKNEKELHDWTLWCGWELVNYGKNSTKAATGDQGGLGIDELMAAPAARVEFFTVDGRRASVAQKGILIQKTTLQNGTVVVRKVRK